MMQGVLFAQRRLPHYRVPFMQAAQACLATRGVRLNVIYGEPTAAERLKRDEGELEGAQRMRHTRYAMGGRLCWQPFDTRGQALVIVSQENRLLFNHWLLRPWRPFKLAFFGHGAHLASTHPEGWRERYKAWTSRQADHWFAYTELSRSLLHRAGVRDERITVVNNAVDTRRLRAEADSWSADELQNARIAWGLTPGRTALFLGSLYAAKGLDTLFAAAAAVHANWPDFRLLVLGDGPDASQVREACAQHPWIRWGGALAGREKAFWMRLADVLWLPGSVGLAVVDGFALGLPTITQAGRAHGPEIAYIQSGRNGYLSAPDVASFAQALDRCWRDEAWRSQLQQGARLSGRDLTVEAMAERFAAGVLQALEG